MRNAYLIMAHDQIDLLDKIIDLLDSNENDIYVHLDSKMENIRKKKCKYSPIYYIPSMDVRWGAYTQIKLEIELLKTARLLGNYDYYHLISGHDMPIKSNKEINAFLEKNYGYEFVSFDEKSDFKNIKNRVEYKHFFQKYYYLLKKGRKQSLNVICIKILEKICVMTQKIFGKRRLNEIELKKGANWFSITEDLVDYVLYNENKIKKMYKYSLCGDEVFLQTLIYNNEKFRKRIYNNNIKCEHDMCLRCIDWNRGSPYTWQIEDYKYLKNNKNLYARKFDEKVDLKIIDKIYKELMNENEESRNNNVS